MSRGGITPLAKERSTVRRPPLAALGLLALSLASLAAAGPARQAAPAAPAPAQRPPAPIASSDDVFSERAIHRSAPPLPPERRQRALDHALDETWTAARLRVDGAPIGVVGVRFKGSMGTLGSCFEHGARVCPKLPLKIRFDRFVESRR